MYEVLDKDTIKSEILPLLSVTKCGCVLKRRSSGSHLMYSLQVENRLPMAYVSSLIFLHREGVALLCMGISANGREMVTGRRCGASFCTIIGLSWTCPAWSWAAVPPPPFVLGSAVAIKYARKGRRPMPYMSPAAKQYRLPCPLPFRVRKTMLATSLRCFLNCSWDLIPRPCPYRDSFLTQMRILTLNSSDGDAMNTRYSQTLPSANAEESKGRKSS